MAQEQNEFGFDFSEFDIKGRTVWIKIPGIVGLELELAPATDDNPAWMSAVRRDLLAMAALYKSENLSDEEAQTPEVQERRSHAAANDQRKRVLDTLLRGWRGAKAKGVDVPYSKAAAREALAKLPDWAVKSLEDQASDRSRYFAARVVTSEEATIVAGNSEAG